MTQEIVSFSITARLQFKQDIYISYFSYVLNLLQVDLRLRE